MHELSIISRIVEIAEEQVRRTGASKVTEIELEIGELAGVEWQALDFAWEIGVQKSVLEHATRQLNKVPGKALCLECKNAFAMHQLFDPCPNCHSFFNEILQGKELRVKTLTVE